MVSVFFQHRPCRQCLAWRGIMLQRWMWVACLTVPKGARRLALQVWRSLFVFDSTKPAQINFTHAQSHLQETSPRPITAKVSGEREHAKSLLASIPSIIYRYTDGSKQAKLIALLLAKACNSARLLCVHDRAHLGSDSLIRLQTRK